MSGATPETFRHRQIEVGGSSLHVVEAGDPEGAPVLLLHGWPQTWLSWRAVMVAASPKVHVIAVDLPGVGGSTGDATDGSKRQVAARLHEMVTTLGLTDLTVVGQDAGALVAYAYLREHDPRAVVLMEAPMPGVDPWDQVLANPGLWHFAFHSVPALPEQLVQGRQREYFDFFFDAFSGDPAAITDEARAAYVDAYSADAALTAGFNWFRAFGQDAKDNRAATEQASTDTPVLYLGSEAPEGYYAQCLRGLRSAGLTSVEQAVVPGAGHFLAEEAPQQVWQHVESFLEL